MTEKDFLDEMSELLDLDTEINMESVLGEIEEWDSLSFVAFLAAMSEHCEGRISPVKVREAKSIRDLYLLIQ